MKRMMRIFGYLKHHSKHRISFNINELNLNQLEFVDYKWDRTYKEAQEDIPKNAPVPTTNNVQMVVYADANHGNCLATRRSTTGILICINKTPVYTYSRRQNTVETLTYSAEFVAARIAVEKIQEY